MAYAYQRRSAWPLATWELLVVAALFLYLIGLDIHGLLSYNSLRRELKSLTIASHRLHKANQKQRAYLRARSSKDLEEGWIRQELGYVKPGEIAVVFLKGSNER